MFENLSKTTAKNFLKTQENVGDWEAIAVIGTSENLTTSENVFIASLRYLNAIVIKMESGETEWDSAINDYYREGILLLIDKCNAVLNKKEVK